MPRKHRRTSVPPVSRAVAIEDTFDRRATIVYWATGGAVLLLLGFLAFFPVQSDDVFMYLAIGRRMVREKALPAIDPFLFSIPNYHWHVAQEWASYLLSYGLFRLGGWTLLIVAKTLLLLGAAGIALTTAWRLRVRSVIVPLLILLAAIAGYHRFIERASLVSDVLTAAVLAIVAIDRAKPGRLRYLLPFIFLAWVNLHPGFYVGLAICGLAVLWDIRRIGQRPVQVFAGCVIASALLCLVNPDGLAGVLYPLRPLFDRSWDIYRTYNYEWLPTLEPGYLHSIHVPFFIALITLCLLIAVTALRQQPWFELSVLAMLIWLGFSAVRFLTTASFALCVLGAVLASKSWLRELGSSEVWPRLNKAASAAVAVAAVLFSIKIAFWGYPTLAGPRQFGGGVDDSMHPIAAADFIDRIGLESNLYNQAGFGAYLAWRWDGQRKLFYHGHVEDLDFFRRNFIGVSETPDQFNRIVNEFHLGAFLLRRPDQDGAMPLVYRLLSQSPDWRLVFLDDGVLFFLRNIPENEAAFTRYAAMVDAANGNASTPASYERGARAARDIQEQQATKSSAASLPILGTWKASWCGLDVSTLRITATDGVLGGTMIANEYVANQAATGCAAQNPHLTGKHSEFPLSGLSFDGQTLRLTVASGTASGEAQTQSVQLRLSNDTLVVIADQPGQEPRVFKRAG